MSSRPNSAHRRRHALALLGLLHVGMGLTLILRGVGVPDPALAILHELLPASVRMALWIGAGLSMVALAASPREKAESIGWGIAMVMPVERVVSYSASALMWIIPGWPPGAVASFGSAFIWTAIAALVWHIARWPEESQPTTGA